MSKARLEIGLAPSPAADVLDTLDYLLEYPHGCTEQTMSRFLPAIKVAQTLERLGIEHDGLKKKLPRYAEAGIKRLLELQHPDGGWGWYANDRTHEMMTPYALHGLIEAEKAGYLVPKADAIDLGLARLKAFINSNNKRTSTTDRIFWLYVRSQRRLLSVDKWEDIEKLVDKELSDQALGMVLEMAVKAKRKALVERVVARLHKTAKKNGGQVHWQTAGFSRWTDNSLEVTAVVLKALIAHDPKDELIPGVMQYFQANKHGKRWGSTKDTALIVDAICAYLSANKLKLKNERGVGFSLNDGKSQSVTFPDGKYRRVTLPASLLKTGGNELRFAKDFAGVGYRVVLRYRQSGATIHAIDGGLKVERTFRVVDTETNKPRIVKPGETLPVGARLTCTVSVSNSDTRNLRYVLVRAPKPSGSEILPAADDFLDARASLREAKSDAVLHHFDEPGQSFSVETAFHLEMAGEFRVPPASAELMYLPEMHGHSDGFHFKVRAKK